MVRVNSVNAYAARELRESDVRATIVAHRAPYMLARDQSQLSNPDIRIGQLVIEGYTTMHNPGICKRTLGLYVTVVSNLPILSFAPDVHDARPCIRLRPSSMLHPAPWR